jgi:hypothetical protein
MKVKTPEWIDFKKQVISVLEIFEKESLNFHFPLNEPDEFNIQVNDKIVFPVFIKKDKLFVIEYDFNSCNTSIRKMSVSMLYETFRIEIVLK